MQNSLLPKPPYFDEKIWGEDTWPILSGSYTGDLLAVRQLLDKDTSLIQTSFAYYQPLHYAVRGGNMDMVKLLLERGAHPLAPGWERLGDETPLAKAIDRERDDMVQVLRAAALNRPSYKWPPQKQKTPEEELKYRFMLSCGYHVDRFFVEQTLKEHPEWATSGLYEAVHHNSPEIIELLLNAGGDVNGHMPYACWFTPLMHALRYPQPRFALAELLLEQGVNINSTNGLGMSALHIVVLQGIPDALNWLLDHGADIDQLEPEFCSTPLGWAARWGRTEMAQLLLHRGADPRLPVNNKWSQPESWARKRNNVEITKLLNEDRLP